MKYEHIGSRKPLVLAQAGFKKDITELFKQTANKINVVMLQHSYNDGLVPIEKQKQVRVMVGTLISDMFTAPDNRNSFAADGVTPLAPYPRILNKWTSFATYQAVKLQTDWLRRNTPHDVFHFLHNATGKNKTIKESYTSPVYIPLHERTDENWYILSDRIWRSDVETQKKMDAIMAQGFGEGISAKDISKRMEFALNPDARAAKTFKPYGNQVSFNAMRLARTEITYGFTQAALASARSNPFVEGVDVARSANGDPKCDECPEHATIDMNGDRVREPYPKDEADEAPFHPHCMCTTLPVVGDQQDAIDSIRGMLNGDIQEDDYPVNPANAWDFTSALLGDILMYFLTQEFDIDRGI